MLEVLESHDIPQLVGTIGIALTYILAIIFNTLNGIGGKFSLDFVTCVLTVLFQDFPYFIAQ